MLILPGNKDCLYILKGFKKEDKEENVGQTVSVWEACPTHYLTVCRKSSLIPELVRA